MNKIEKVIMTVFILIGLIFIISGVLIFKASENFKKNGIETTAVITDIVRYNDESSVYIKYIVNDKEYNQKLNYYTSNMHIGQTLKIYYDSDNPNRIQSTGGTVVLVAVFGGIGGVFFLIGIIVLGVNVRRKKLNKRLVENGRKIYADLYEIVINGSYRVNRRHPYNITCKWQDKSSGILYLFKSENIWFDPSSIIEEKNITKLPVYVDENDFKKYYVEIDSIVEKVQDLR